MILKSKIAASIAALVCVVAAGLFFSALPALADHGSGSSGGCNQLLDFDCDGAVNRNDRTFVTEQEYISRGYDLDDFDPSIGSGSTNRVGQCGSTGFYGC